MDVQRDQERFRKLLARLCATLDKPMTDELLESWWKALRHVDFEVVSARMETFIVRADESTRFPRPAQMRPKDLVPMEGAAAQRNCVRDYWRSCIVHDAVQAFGYRGELVQFEELLIAHRDDLGRPLRDLLDELEVQDRRDGRTEGQHRYVQRRCEELAHAFPHLRSEHAQQLPPPPRQADQRLAGF